MQITRAEKFRLGVFVILSVSILVSVLFYMMGRRLIEKEDYYYVRYEESVDGLLPAASVKLNGVMVGKVVELNVDTSDVRKILVKFSVKRGTPIKSDMVANLAGGLSITGLKNIEISGGTNEASYLAPESVLPAGISQMKMLTGQAETIALKFETLLNNILSLTNQENIATVTQVLRSLRELSSGIDTLLKDNRKAFSEIPTEISGLLKQLEITAGRADAAVKEFQSAQVGRKIGQAVDEYNAVGKEINKKVKALDLNTTMQQVNKATNNVVSVAENMDNTLRIIQEDLGAIMENIKATSDNMEDFSRMIKENPSLLLRGEDKRERGQ